MNELLLFGTLILVFGTTLLLFRFFGRSGLFVWSAVATILANIEVLVVIRAFGLEQTLGNVLFAVTFLITDILSECYGKKTANKAVWLGICSSIFFVILSQSWLMYQPSESDWVSPSLRVVFEATPRVVIASLVVYGICQFFDVWLYHKWWTFTEKKFGNRRAFLWLRNNGSTLISQFLNTVLFNVFAFAGIYETPTLLSIIFTGYLIYVFTSLLDTPFVYWARKIHDGFEKKGITD
ncbi:MAG: queuosine precursor transporter [Lachnospiraceae bacterium]|nr:queuosine precursor transporter [Lachnospiraceae bacterium]